MLFTVVFQGCVRYGPYDLAVFARVLKKADKELVLDYDNALFDNGTYCFFYSFAAGDDIALSLHSDENGNLYGATVSMLSPAAVVNTEKFMKLCGVICGEFLPEDEAGSAVEQTGIYKEEQYFTEEHMYSFKGNGHIATFISSPDAVSFSVLPEEKIKLP